MSTLKRRAGMAPIQWNAYVAASQMAGINLTEHEKLRVTQAIGCKISNFVYWWHEQQNRFKDVSSLQGDVTSYVILSGQKPERRLCSLLQVVPFISQSRADCSLQRAQSALGFQDLRKVQNHQNSRRVFSQSLLLDWFGLSMQGVQKSIYGTLPRKTSC